MGGDILKFQPNPKFLHKRSEGLTKRGEARQERLMRGPSKAKLAKAAARVEIAATKILEDLLEG